MFRMYSELLRIVFLKELVGLPEVVGSAARFIAEMIVYGEL